MKIIDHDRKTTDLARTLLTHESNTKPFCVGERGRVPALQRLCMTYGTSLIGCVAHCMYIYPVILYLLHPCLHHPGQSARLMS